MKWYKCSDIKPDIDAGYDGICSVQVLCWDGEDPDGDNDREMVIARYRFEENKWFHRGCDCCYGTQFRSQEQFKYWTPIELPK